MADDVPDFPPVKKRNKTLREMYERDNASPHHKAYAGKTSPEMRPDPAVLWPDDPPETRH